MIPLLLLLPPLLAGGAVAAGIGKLSGRKARRIRAALVGSAAPDTPSVRAAPPSPTGDNPLRRRLADWDARYQELIQTRVDPLLAGRERSRQLAELTHGRSRAPSPAERQANYGLGLGVGALAALGLARLTTLPLRPLVLGIGLFNLWPSARECWRIAVQERRLSVLHLGLLYMSVLWFGGYYLIGSIGLILGRIAHKLEMQTQQVARHSLTHLLGEQPERVYVLCDGAELEIALERLRVGDILVLDAGQPVPVDGTIVRGAATLDQHRLTGESRPIDKGVGDAVLAGTLVLGGRINVQVEQTGAATLAGRIAAVLDRTVERQQVRIADMFAPLERTRLPMLGGSLLAWLVGGPTAAGAALGCNYLFSLIPLRLLTLLNGLNRGARQGLLIKDGRALERLAKADTVLFDKTGTLTLEQPRVVAVHGCADLAEDAVLRLAAAAEQRQSHPIARAILTAAAERGLELPVIVSAHCELGLGLRVELAGQAVRIGSARFLAAAGLALPPALEAVQVSADTHGHTLVFVALDALVAGAIELASSVRPEAAWVIGWLQGQGLALYLVSGDQEAPTRALAETLGVTGYFADALPQQKADQVRALQAAGRRVCFIGDGINDAVALREAAVSVSLRGATTVATDAAQVVLMDGDLTQLPRLWELAWAYDASITRNTRLAEQFSLLAIGGVLLLPFKFWIVELLWFTQAITGLRIATAPLMLTENDPADAAAGDPAT